MAESMSTPTKISPRNPVCRLCGDCHEPLRIFSKAGSLKDLCAKVHKTCGIEISENNVSSKVLSRGCFIRKQDGTVNSESPVHRGYPRVKVLGTRLQNLDHIPWNRWDRSLISHFKIRQEDGFELVLYKALKMFTERMPRVMKYAWNFVFAWCCASCVTQANNRLLDGVFLISRIIKVEVIQKSKAEVDNSYRDLYYSGYHKNRIWQLFYYTLNEKTCKQGHNQGRKS